jgi:heme-degrading monooxygenase HmoA
LGQDGAEDLITEHAILEVKPGRHADFETAMRKAVPLISASKGFLKIKVLPCIETPGRYVLLVQWASVEDHEKGFRGSDRYQQWKALLHGFYDPFPRVEHYGPSIVG